VFSKLEKALSDNDPVKTERVRQAILESYASALEPQKELKFSTPMPAATSGVSTTSAPPPKLPKPKLGFPSSATVNPTETTLTPLLMSSQGQTDRQQAG
jgi:hypothetical protein